MKQLIVLIATIVLGISISGVILGFRSTADNLGTAANNGMNGIVEALSGAAIENNN